MPIKQKADTARSLGLSSVYRALSYRLSVKLGINPVRRITATLPSGDFFANYNISNNAPISLPQSMSAFGHIQYPIVNGIPDWFYSPLTQRTFTDVNKVWYKISDFDNEIGDIKGVWEASRFDWLIDFIKQEQTDRDGKALAALDIWLNDWCQKNPAYLGPNWKCGQEASIRVMHIITALIGLGSIRNINDNIIGLLDCHLRRIVPTISYAIAQDNNHGTSEAVALYIGGAVLNNIKPDRQYLKWQRLGEKWLINRAMKLIMPDGGFSQYSVNYHRLMLDSYCLAEIVRRQLNLDKFPAKVYKRLGNATDWLYVLVQDSGDAPNLGANDGANLLPICDSDYRDFRPTVQLASTLFKGKSYYPAIGKYDASLDFFNLDKLKGEKSSLPSKSQWFNHSGLITSANNDFFLCFKIPKFKFRPSQCDALHLDVWFQNENILRDGGTYSYNTTTADIDYYSGVKSHNTVEFDSHLQMPRLSRFLFGSWLKPKSLTYKKDKFSCGYQDYWQCEHTRIVQPSSKSIIVTDQIRGFKQQAILRWRLIPSEWILNKNIISNGKIAIEISSDSEVKIHLTQGEESRFFYQKTNLPVLEIIATEPTNLVTEIKDIT